MDNNIFEKITFSSLKFLGRAVWFESQGLNQTVRPGLYPFHLLKRQTFGFPAGLSWLSEFIMFPVQSPNWVTSQALETKGLTQNLKWKTK